MAKKRACIDLAARQIVFESREGLCEVLRLEPNTMTVDVALTAADGKRRTERLPFAHLPRHVKQQIKPL